MISIDSNLLFTLIAASVTAFLGFLVFLHNRKNLSSKIFITHSFVGVSWAVANYFSLIAGPESALVLIRLVLCLAVPYVLLFFGFVYTFPSETINQNQKKIFYVTIICIILLCLLAASPFVFKKISFTNNQITPNPGSLAITFGVCLIIFLVMSTVAIIKNYIRAKTGDPLKNQWLSIGFGLLLSFTLLIFFVLLRVSLYHDTTYVVYSPLFVLPIFLGTSYAILKHHLFNVKVFAAETLVFALLVTSFFGVVIAATPVTRTIGSAVTIAILLIGILLIRSVRREVQQRERLEALTQELSAANTKLKELDQQKSQFLSFASHDLKSPINIIKQFATLIADGTYKEPAKVAETVQKIKTTADRATHLVDDFLDIRKIEEGRMDYAFEVKDIIPFVKGITEDYAPVAKAEKNILVSFSSTLPSCNIKMDTTRLRQVVQNLLSNSLKYTETSTDGKQNTIQVSITDEQKTVLITVKDTGLGMDKTLLPILFEQFHRDPSVAKKIQGTGLGLYISKQITIAHGGEIWAQSEGKGFGSTFFVRLPKA